MTRSSSSGSLRGAALPHYLDTSSSNLIRDFFEKALASSIRYDRGVGYFSSGWLKVNSSGIQRFAEAGGKARWITSPILEGDDWAALVKGNEARSDSILYRTLEQSLAELSTNLEKDTLSTLAWLVADEVLDFRLAVPRGDLSGEFHDKFGVFTDKCGDRVSFNGSYNDSIHGLRNYESLKIFFSWENAGAPFVEADAARFSSLWENHDPNVRVYAIPEAARARILKLRSPVRPYSLPSGENGAGLHGRPFSQILRDYQKDAVNNWFRHGCRGIFKMATGTGKTITALAVVSLLREYLAERSSRLITVVVCPFIHLVSQWGEEAERFGISSIRCFQDRATWVEDVERAIAAVDSGASNGCTFIVTNRTFSGASFQRLIRDVASPLLIVADEVHNITVSQAVSALPLRADYRLGLSATPERAYDEEGSQEIGRYFGPVVYEMGLREALGKGVLCPYRYHPIIVELTSDEADKYMDLTRGIAQRATRVLENPMNDPGVQALLIRRARLTATASGKIPILKGLMEGRTTESHDLFYCGDGRVDAEADGEELRQVDAVVEMLGRELGMRVGRYTAETFLSERDRLRRDFADGKIQGLVAIRCLDEGVDIPEIERAFILASSTNPRQFIQRRGRILRRAPGKVAAEIWDFIVAPPSSLITDQTFNTERGLLARELKRVNEFAELSLNGSEAHMVLRDLKKNYNLLHL